MQITSATIISFKWSLEISYRKSNMKLDIPQNKRGALEKYTQKCRVIMQNFGASEELNTGKV